MSLLIIPKTIFNNLSVHMGRYSLLRRRIKSFIKCISSDRCIGNVAKRTKREYATKKIMPSKSSENCAVAGIYFNYFLT